ncbi:MAG: copper chaperone PCu(A)C [Bradyrhizobium sp.]|uniref:copper chaperone PCu(A)C n=1 Tax=Bradyrhizobium sp. TaxID=376 RepID=UPI001DC68A96|nr:copper chaperone PCu(A)C [Bradyrhizobium sp.]MBV9559484.1 copper chaperone PCu(A)C [Bradyrhizobium sp.]
MRAAVILVGCIAVAIGGCSSGGDNNATDANRLRVSDAWIRLAAVPGTPSAAYFTIHGGPTSDRLTSISSPQVRRAEMHETMAADHGMARMAPVEQLAVPAGGTVTFAPGGRHVMLFGLDAAATAGREVRLDLAFASGRTLAARARVRAMGDERQ